MKIFVVPRHYVEQQFDKDPDWIQGKWIISIFSSGDVSPLPDRYNILKYAIELSTADLKKERRVLDLLESEEAQLKAEHNQNN